MSSAQLRPKRPWMPFYVADYLADTTHLSTTEHGAYMLLLLDYWRNGYLPTEKDQLARITRMSTKEWGAIASTVQRFFGPSWRHERLDAEILKAARISETKRQNVGQRTDRRATDVTTGVGTDVGSKDVPDEDTLHTSHYTKGPSQEIKGAFSVVGEGDTPPARDGKGTSLNTRGAA